MVDCSYEEYLESQKKYIKDASNEKLFDILKYHLPKEDDWDAIKTYMYELSIRGETQILSDIIAEFENQLSEMKKIQNDVNENSNSIKHI